MNMKTLVMSVICFVSFIGAMISLVVALMFDSCGMEWSVALYHDLMIIMLGYVILFFGCCGWMAIDD